MNDELVKLRDLMPCGIPREILNVLFDLTNESIDNNIYNGSIEVLNRHIPSLHNQVKVFSLFMLAICYKAVGKTYMFEDCLNDISNVTLYRDIDDRNNDRFSNMPLLMNPIGISYYLINGSPARKRREKELDEYKRKILKINTH